MLERDRRLVRPLHAAGRPRSAGRACCSTSPAARICSAARRRYAATSWRGSHAQGFQARAAVADTVGCAWAVARYGTELRVLSGSDPRRTASAAARRAADRAGDRRRAGAGRPQAHRRRDRPPARAARRALRRRICAPPRPGARARGRADRAAPAGAALCDRAPLRRADRARGRRARHHRASRARTGEADGAARRRRAPDRGRAVPHRRQGAPHRRRHRRAVARRRAHPRAVRRAAGGDRRRMRSRLRLRRGAARRARDRALRSGADRARRARPCGGAGASRRPARRAFRAAPRDAARAAGHAYPGICGGGGGGGGNSSSYPPPCGEGRERSERGGGRAKCISNSERTTPLPTPPPQGGRERSCSPHTGIIARTRLPRPHPPHSPVRAAGADRSDRRGAGRTAGAIHLAARALLVAHAEGPERIAMEWWRDEQGQALRAIISGSRAAKACASGSTAKAFSTLRNGRSPPTWFLHGVFA